MTERATELVVIVALMGAGLKLDRPLGGRSWALTWRLLAITMPLRSPASRCSAGAGSACRSPSALLLAALLAPTDPVLASDVQVGPPGTGEEDEVRFGLTSEAGLNDGLAFPFTNLAIALARRRRGASDGWFAGLAAGRRGLEDRGRRRRGLAGRPAAGLADLPPSGPGEAVAHRRRLRRTRDHLPVL